MNKRKVELKLKNKQEYLSNIEKYSKKPLNVIFILADDLGHHDISCFGSKVIKTPNLDKMADDGVMLNNFYAASPLCSPSRFSCLTGRYPTRGFVNSVFFSTKHTMRFMNDLQFPHGVKGILPDEITIADALKQNGYKTALIGKWHLGDKSPYLPNEMGFEYFYGSHYSNDMKPYEIRKNEKVVIEADDVNQDVLTMDFTKEICNYIDENTENPFFIYYASPFPHHPVHASEKFKRKSLGGPYGDCVEELDWSVGEIRKKLIENNLLENTLVIFSSDNGPWHEGSPGLHRGRKGNNFDGGQVVPFIASCPSILPSGTVKNANAMNIDLFPTILSLANIKLPNDREIDGVDILPFLQSKEDISPHKKIYFIKGKKIIAVKDDNNFKYCIRHTTDNAKYVVMQHGPFLFDMNIDVNESYNVLKNHKELSDLLNKEIKSKQEQFDENPRGWL